MTNKSDERLTGADAGVCVACLGFAAIHNDWCEVKQMRTVASIIDDDEVERLEQEGKQCQS